MSSNEASRQHKWHPTRNKRGHAARLHSILEESRTPPYPTRLQWRKRMYRSNRIHWPVWPTWSVHDNLQITRNLKMLRWPPSLENTAVSKPQVCQTPSALISATTETAKITSMGDFNQGYQLDKVSYHRFIQFIQFKSKHQEWTQQQKVRTYKAFF